MDRRQQKKRAGSSARQEYERLKREWRKRTRKQFFLIGSVFVAIIIVTRVLAAIWPSLDFTSGLISGGLIAIFMALRETPPGWVEQWFDGSMGEQRTDEQLSMLEPEGWIIIRDLRSRGYNIDHVAVGPPGVFVIDSKNLDGTVTCSGDELRLYRPGASLDSRPEYSSTEPARQVRGQAAQLNERLRRRVGKSVWVTGVVAVWAKLDPPTVEGRNMYFCRGDALVQWLRSRPQRLDAEQIRTIGTALTPARRRKAA
ncbi:MAG TPA: nuclease-related domain-containing protein [Nocardioidaceae bacterium]|nr:nuclease-related domain-containing protein [Nocardioidaceae bacterium]